MQVPARVYATRKMLLDTLDERSINQLINVAALPGIEKYALAMPDIHEGYGFPIGGVAALRTQDGVISPGGVGYDINCGVRLLKSNLSLDELEGNLVKIVNQIQRDVPSGAGRGGKFKLNTKELDKVLNTGLKWAKNNGYTEANDEEVVEEKGSIKFANAKKVSDRAKKRGSDQLGTLGAGNHFLEVQVVSEIFDKQVAKVYGLFKNQITVMIHSGSRGLGHQVCTDYVRLMNQVMEKYKIKLKDKELACAPFRSKEGQDYFSAMAGAANFAWVNRQLMSYLVRGAWQQILGAQHKLNTLYDVAHNIAKLEKHASQEYIVHRKGATRAFGPGHVDLPLKYQKTGQPVLIPGSMGTYSYILAGTRDAMRHSFGSACHGAGRRLSRAQAKKSLSLEKLKKQLDDYKVVVRAGSKRGLLEEAPQAYKDINDVVDVITKTGIGLKVAQLKPIGIIKG